MREFNFKNNKTRTVTTIMAILMIGLSLLSPPAIMPSVNAQQQQQAKLQSDNTCTKQVEQQMQTKGQLIDSKKAIQLATGNQEFQSMVKGYSSNFDSIFYNWTFDSQCNTTLKNVNVVYFLHYANGTQKNLVVTLDPTLAKIVGFNEYVPPRYSTTSYPPNWAGYEFQGNSGATNPVYEADNSWTQTTVSVPYTGGCVSPQTCDLATWSGLEDELGAYPDQNLAQAGTDAVVDCIHSGCTYTYKAWYEFLPNNPVICTGVNVHAGDSMTADVVNSNKPGSAYHISVVDSTSSTSCSMNYTYSAMTTPYYGDFIAERSCLSNCSGSNPTYSTLAKFTTFSQGGTIYYTGATQYIDTPYSNGWYNQDIMTNSGNTNIYNGAVTPSSTFSETWHTSSGT
ncbi:MAG: G1 family glutamic endopeptidase [Nitrosotalea sp.]